MMALDARTGGVLMTNSGTMTEDAFRATVLGSFPSLDPKDLILIRDGQVQGRPGTGREPSPKAGSCQGVIWKGSFLDHGGYALMNREICLRLLQRGFRVKAEVLPTGAQVDPVTQATIRAMEAERVPGMHEWPMVVGFTPMSISRGRKRTVFYTMMETQGLHPEFVKRCNDSATEVWVPCKFYADVFRRAGVTRPTSVIPLGVNHLLFNEEAREPVLAYEKMPSGKKTQKLPPGKRFMSLFGWSYRKGPDLLCRSFIEEFSASEDAILVIYSRYMGSSEDRHKQHVRDEIAGYYEKSGKKNPPRIFYCGDNIPANSLPGCYASADAFVFCSRGEGFGLILAEAGACGVPVISACNTAMTEFLDDSVAHCVHPEGTAPANDKLCWISEYYRDQDFAVMGEESILRFRKGMRDVYDEAPHVRERASRFRERILADYTWEKCADRVASELRKGKK